MKASKSKTKTNKPGNMFKSKTPAPTMGGNNMGKPGTSFPTAMKQPMGTKMPKGKKGC